MESHIRERLEALAERLHLHRGADDEELDELQATVQKALDEDDHEGLGDQLEEQAVGFQAEHPDLADFLRRTADALSAGGL